jgi:sulfite exporter TauE/SafE
MEGVVGKEGGGMAKVAVPKMRVGGILFRVNLFLLGVFALRFVGLGWGVLWCSLVYVGVVLSKAGSSTMMGRVSFLSEGMYGADGRKIGVFRSPLYFRWSEKTVRL